MSHYNYSVIIPHKNIPELLQRCLDSIPQREDLQVIVVDDNSTPDKVDFAHFPGLERPHTVVTFDKTGKGAGHARNVGLDQAQGKWVIFLDADDLLVSDADTILSESVNREEDILFYNYQTALSSDLSVPGHRKLYHPLFEQYAVSGDETNHRFRFQALWGKLIKRKLIEQWHIRCDETKYSNDVSMSVKAGLHASAIAIYDKPLFIITERPGSLAASQLNKKLKTTEEYNIRMEVALSSQAYVYSQGLDIDLPLYKREAWRYIRHYPGAFTCFFIRSMFRHPRLCKNILIHCLKKGFGRLRR